MRAKSLSDWIAQVGDKAAAQLLGIKERTVRSWRYGDRVPNRRHAALILARTKLRYEQIYGSQ